ncbi:hypothetical protein MMC25_004682 [Agyrium rufum]|nr:hypothetical protein [Agyrium rufum]
MASLEERLRKHNESFKGLLELVSADDYFGRKDTTDQWKQKKRSKQEKLAAKRAKLDPDTNMTKTALEVIEEQARKRKRQDGDPDGVEGSEMLAEEGLPTDTERLSKKLKKDGLHPPATARPEQTKTDKNRAKRERKRINAEAKRKALEGKQERKREKQEQKAAAEEEQSVLNMPAEDESNDEAEDGDDHGDQMKDGMEKLDVSGLHDEEEAPAESSDQVSAGDSSPQKSPLFDLPPTQSGTSSISSISTPLPRDNKSQLNASANTATDPTQLPSTSTSTTTTQEPNTPHIPKLSSSELHARLQARIQNLRAARHAPASGDPSAPRSRQELIEARRLKEEQRRAHKKELRRLAREKELQQRDLTLARGSPLVLSASASGAASPAHENNFSFSRIAFPAGKSGLSGLSGGGGDDDNDDNNDHDNPDGGPPSKPRKKGPCDPRTALLAHQARESRLAGLDDAKKAEIEEKDAWFSAKKRAQGEKVRDDGKLLAKAVKRVEQKKRKSEREWKDREEKVKTGIEKRQSTRETNLRKRREEKGGGKKGGAGKGKGGKKGGGDGAKKGAKKTRPGFEGSFKAVGRR